jgi:hypothetical protein
MLSRDHRRRAYVAAVTAPVVATITNGDDHRDDRDRDDIEMRTTLIFTISCRVSRRVVIPFSGGLGLGWFGTVI